MNADQKRLLLETEYHFYRLSLSVEAHRTLLKKWGWKAEPNLRAASDASLEQLNFKFRSFLRSTSAIALPD